MVLTQLYSILEQGYDKDELDELPLVVELSDRTRLLVVDGTVESIRGAEGERIILRAATLAELGVDQPATVSS